MTKRTLIQFLLGSVLSLLIMLPLTVAAQQSAEQTRCRSFVSSFNIKKEPDTPDNLSDNFVENVKLFCTAQELISFVINLLLLVVGSVSVIFIIVGGFQYMTSGGNEEQAEKGRKTLVNAVIGLVVVIMSFAIVRIVINAITKGPGGSGGTTTNGTGGNGSTTSGGSVEFGKNNISFPGTIKAKTSMLVSFSASTSSGVTPEALRNKVSEICGAAFNIATFEVLINGQELGKTKFILEPTGSISAGMSVVVPDTLGPAGSNIVTASICGSRISEATY